MDTDRVIQLLEEIRALQRQQVDAQQQALRNQADAIRAQQEAMARGRRLQTALGVVIAVVLIMVLVLLRYVIQRYS
jgi:DNA-binding protein H-NS